MTTSAVGGGVALRGIEKGSWKRTASGKR